MKMLTTNKKFLAGRIRTIAVALIAAFCLSTFAITGLSQGREISIPADRVEALQPFSIGIRAKLFPYTERSRASREQSGLLPEATDPTSVYANSTTFTGYILFNAGQASGITRLVSDNLALVGTAPHNIGFIYYIMCNGNPGPVSARAKVRYYLDNAGAPGTFITGFNFPAFTVPNASCQPFTAKLPLASHFTVSSNAMWAAMSFDNVGGTATNEQMNFVAMAFFNPPDIGTSNNNFHLSTGTPGEFTASNPAGSIQTFNSTGGPPDPPDNFGFELRRRVKIAPFTRDGAATQPPSSNISWTVTLDTTDAADGTQLTGLTAANFALGTTGSATGSIASVVPNGGGNNSWTVNATTGPGEGTVTLNLNSETGLGTALAHTLPVAGGTYTIGAAGGSIGGPGVVISQVYGGGGGSTGTYLHDYVELKNTSSSPKSLSGLSLYYGSATGQFASSAGNLFALPNATIPPGGYYLVQTSGAGSAGAALPVTPDATTTNLTMSGTSGKVALVAGLPSNTCGATATPCALPHYQIVDVVAWGAANNAEGGAPTNGGAAITSTQGNVRKGGGCTDTNNNNADFDIVTAPVPRNSATTAAPCGILTNTRTPNDYDGDGRTDYVVLRDSNGAAAEGFVDWYISMNSNAAMHQITWGIYNEKTEDLAPADYDGDGKTDIAVWRRSQPFGTFHIILSSNFTLVSDQLGFPTDDPVPGDYNGDGKADVAVLRQEVGGMTGWYYRPAFGADYVAIALAGSGAEAGGDYDGDGIYDPAVFDDSGAPPQFRIQLSSGGLSTRAIGEVGDLAAPGDYDGDGKTDPAVIRNVGGFWQWTYRPSSGGNDVVDSWGIAPADMPVPGDYNGDGRWDYAIWRPGAQGEFFVMTPGTIKLIFTRPWGLADDFPLGYGTHVSND